MIELLPALVFQAALVMARIGSALMLLPGIGEPDVPATIRLALAVTLVGLVLPGLAGTLPDLPPDVPTLLRLVVTEIAVGLWLGSLARLVTMALAQAGQVIATMIGLASPLQNDPSFGAQGSASRARCWYWRAGSMPCRCVRWPRATACCRPATRCRSGPRRRRWRRRWPIASASACGWRRR